MVERKTSASFVLFTFLNEQKRLSGVEIGFFHFQEIEVST